MDYLFSGECRLYIFARGLFAFAMPVFGTGTAGKIDFDDFDLFARGVAEGRRAHQGDGFRVEQVRGVKKSGIPADHEVGCFTR